MQRLQAIVDEAPALRAEAPDATRAVVAVEVAPAGCRDGAAAVDVAAGDRATEVVAVDGDRNDEPSSRVRPLARRVARAAFPDAPAVVVQAAPLRWSPDVDLLPRVLPHVAD